MDNGRWYRCDHCGCTRHLYRNASGFITGGEAMCYKCNVKRGGCEWSGPFDTEQEARGGLREESRWSCISCHAPLISWGTDPNDIGKVCGCGGYRWLKLAKIRPKPEPDRRWWRCKGCGRAGMGKDVPDWNNHDGSGLYCYVCDANPGWHGPFATEQEAKDYDVEKYGGVDSLFDNIERATWPRWQANTDHATSVLWKANVSEEVLNSAIMQSLLYNKAYLSDFTKQSKEDNKMSAYFCDVCRDSFPIEEVNQIAIEAMKWGRDSDQAIETNKVSRKTYTCDTCFATLMAEPTVAKLPWSKWTKDDDDE